MSRPLCVSMIGHGGMLQSCVALAEGQPNIRVRHVFARERSRGAERHLVRVLARRGIDAICYNDLAEVLEVLSENTAQDDLLVSVYNENKLGGDLLEHYAMAINFHDSPLPRYAGRNAVSWALLTGEREHGVTWHEIAATYDAGAIVAQELFTVEPEWTALNLAVKSVQVGCRLFSELLAHVVRGTLQSREQDLAKRTYFGRRLVPFGGRFPFLAPFHQLERLRRATAYFPMPNGFCTPRIVVQDTALDLIKFRVSQETADAMPGTLIAHLPSGIAFATLDGILTAELVAFPGNKPVPATDESLRRVLQIGACAELDTTPYDEVGMQSVPSESPTRIELPTGRSVTQLALRRFD